MSLLKAELRKVILFFLVVFFTWQILYVVNWILNGLDWMVAYSIVLVVITCFFNLDKQKTSDLGLKKPPHWKRYMIIGFASAIFIILYWVALSILTLPIMLKEQIFPYGILSILYNALFALVVGLVEETSFRGYILSNLRKIYSDTKAIIYSALLFGLYHISFVWIILSTMSISEAFTYWSSYVLFTFVVGLFLGYFCVNSGGTIIGTITHHSAHIFLSSFIPYSLATSFTIGHLVSTSAYIIILSFLFFLKRKRWLIDN